jgi:hypothetical protein
MTRNEQEALYAPSWIDRFNDWLETRPLQAWLLHIVFGVALIVIQMLFLQLDDGLGAGEILPVIVYNGLAIPFLLALIQLLDNQAMAALKAMRPVLDLGEQAVDQTAYRLANMPFLAPLLAGSTMMILTILTPLVSAEPVRYAALEQRPIFAVVFHIIDKGSAFLFGVVLYHTIRQLRQVNNIHMNHVRINLFHLQPLQAFSKLTASTALGLLVFVYGWMIINPELLADPLIAGYALVFTALAVTVFVWPLWGAHNLMVMEKEKALQEIDLRLEATFSKFNQLVQADDYEATDRLNGVIASLEAQYQRISAIPTWPWRSETARLALTAIALPLILMIIQSFLLQVLNR